MVGEHSVTVIEGASFYVFSDDPGIETLSDQTSKSYGFSSSPVKLVGIDRLESVGDMEGLKSLMDVERVWN